MYTNRRPAPRMLDDRMSPTQSSVEVRDLRADCGVEFLMFQEVRLRGSAASARQTSPDLTIVRFLKGCSRRRDSLA